MADNALTVEMRESAGKGVARKLRADGRIPAVFYGKREGSVSIALDPGSLRRLIEKSDAGMNTLIDLHVEGGGALEGKTVLIKELQRDPVRGRYLHADFYAVDLERRAWRFRPGNTRGPGGRGPERCGRDCRQVAPGARSPSA